MEKYSGKVFVSYSWSTPEHEQWVLDLAERLTQSGIHVVIDKWDLREGHDTIAFMEGMVTSPEISKVIIVCDKVYAKKADARSGGVGVEAQIISPDIYSQRQQDKFVAVIAEKDSDGKAYVPAYYKSRIYIDLTDGDRHEEEYERLVRWVYGKPVHVRPEIGKAPSYITGVAIPTSGTASLAKRACDAFRNGKEYRRGALDEYFRAVRSQLESSRIPSADPPFDDLCWNAIAATKPARDEFLTVFDIVVRYGEDEVLFPRLLRFFEGLVQFFEPPSGTSHYYETQFDHFRFFAHEIFLGCLAILIREDRLEAAAKVLNATYHFERRAVRGSREISFSGIWEEAESLEQRRARLNVRSGSLRADLLRQRCEDSELRFEHLMQADFLCFLNRSIANAFWFPETLIFAAGHRAPFEVFARARTPIALHRVLDMIGNGDVPGVMTKIRSLVSSNSVPRWGFERFNCVLLSNLDSW